MISKYLRIFVPRAIRPILKKYFGILYFSIKSTTKPSVSIINQRSIKLHLGCGDIKLKGFVNVDSLRTIATDVISNITTLDNFADGSATLIYASHVIEHFSHDEVPPLLKRWHEILAPGGTIRLSVPDIDKIVNIYTKNWDHFHRDGNSPWIGLFYGGQKDQYDFHKTGYNSYWLELLLRNAGFVDMQEYPHLPHFCGEGVTDGSLLLEPFGEFFSLNMLAYKPI